jgi:hypothetical protein
VSACHVPSPEGVVHLPHLGADQVGGDRLGGLGLHCALEAQVHSRLFHFFFSFSSALCFCFCFVILLALIHFCKI